MVDYVLTIGISVAAGASAIIAYLPSLAGYRDMIAIASGRPVRASGPCERADPSRPLAVVLAFPVAMALATGTEAPSSAIAPLGQLGEQGKRRFGRWTSWLTLGVVGALTLGITDLEVHLGIGSLCVRRCMPGGCSACAETLGACCSPRICTTTPTRLHGHNRVAWPPATRDTALLRPVAAAASTRQSRARWTRYRAISPRLRTIVTPGRLPRLPVPVACLLICTGCGPSVERAPAPGGAPLLRSVRAESRGSHIPYLASAA